MIYLQLVNGAAFKIARAEQARLEGEMWVCRDAESNIVLALDRKVVAIHSRRPLNASQMTELP